MELNLLDKVYETDEYDKFTYVKDNRIIGTNKKLEEEIKEKGILSPILVNEKYEVIDGQHRLEIAKKLGIKIPYIVIKGAGKSEIISINTTGKQWTIEDFINSYAQEGIQEYIMLQQLAKKYVVNISTLCSLSFNSTDTYNPTKKVKQGKLKFYNHDFLLSFLDFYQDLIDNTALEHVQALPKSLYMLYRLKKFDPKRLYDKTGLIANRLKGIHKQTLITQIIIETYNMRLRDTSPHFIKHFNNALGNVEFLEEIKDELSLNLFSYNHLSS